MQDLMNEMNRLKGELHASMKRLRQNGETLAQREADYQVKKARAVVEMKSQGCSITEIGLTIKGQPEVSDALFARDMAKAMYEANQEHINVVKLELRVLENQIAREWSNGEA